jgi:hypothetical protein
MATCWVELTNDADLWRSINHWPRHLQLALCTASHSRCEAPCPWLWWSHHQEWPWPWWSDQSGMSLTLVCSVQNILDLSGLISSSWHSGHFPSRPLSKQPSEERCGTTMYLENRPCPWLWSVQSRRPLVVWSFWNGLDLIDLISQGRPWSWRSDQYWTPLLVWSSKMTLTLATKLKLLIDYVFPFENHLRSLNNCRHIIIHQTLFSNPDYLWITWLLL